MSRFQAGPFTLSAVVPSPFGNVLFPANPLRHWFKTHCLRQQPPVRQYREDHRRVFSKTVIDVLGSPNADDYGCDQVAIAPFVAEAGRLLAEAVPRGQHVLFDEYAIRPDGGAAVFLHTGSEILTRPTWVAVLRELESGWHFWTGYFRHKSDRDRKTLRSAARRILDFYTDGTLRVPAPDFRVWVKNRTQYRTNIRFGDLAAWGESGGVFDMGRIPPW